MKIYTCNELISKVHPIKTFFLKPIFYPKSLSMLYAAPGIGKSFTSFWMAAAMAGNGHFLKWRSEERARVLYVDGEMGTEDCQERLTKLAVSIDYDILPENLKFISPDEENEGEIPLISDASKHGFYLNEMKNRDVLILDNYGCLTARVGRETDEDVWTNAWKLIKRLRAQGKSILIIHHAGKAGAQLGTSRKEHPMNWIIELSRPAVYEAAQGARFDLKFTKNRGIRGPDLDPLTVELTEREDRFEWLWADRDAEIERTILEMQRVGMSAKEIAHEIQRPLFFVKSKLNQEKIAIENPQGESPYLYDDNDRF